MDHQRKSPVKRISPKMYIAMGVMFFGIALYVLFSLDLSSRRIVLDNLLIGTVEFGDLDIRVGANGTLLAKEIEYLVSQVEGRVTNIHVRPGDQVVKGQVLVELTNSLLVSEYVRAQSALEGARAEKISFQVDIENQLLNQQSATIQEEFNLESARLQLVADTQLIERDMISQIDFQRSQLNVQQLEKMFVIAQERLEKAEENLVSQLAVQESKISQALQTLARSSEQVSSLQIVAGMNGILQEMNLNIGERLQPGSQVGKLARQDILYAQLNVPSRQASNLVIGQRVEVDTRSGVIEGVISRIDPAVTDGTVLIDVNLTSELPRAARPELAVEGTIYVAEINDSLYVNKPAFTRINSRQTIYRLDADGQYAQRVVIDVGQASVNYIEILDGLIEGDRIILSDSSEWQDYERVLLK